MEPTLPPEEAAAWVEYVNGQTTATYGTMRAVDQPLRLIAVGEGTFPNSDTWNTEVLKIAGCEIQYLAIHDYTSVAQNAKAANPRASKPTTVT